MLWLQSIIYSVQCALNQLPLEGALELTLQRTQVNTRTVVLSILSECQASKSALYSMLWLTDKHVTASSLTGCTFLPAGQLVTRRQVVQVPV